MLATLRTRLSLVIGVVMILLALFIPVSTLVLGRRSVTGTLAVDLAFAAFFLLRGIMNVRRGVTGPGSLVQEGPRTYHPEPESPAGENPERRGG